MEGLLYLLSLEVVAHQAYIRLLRVGQDVPQRIYHRHTDILVTMSLKEAIVIELKLGVKNIYTKGMFAPVLVDAEEQGDNAGENGGLTFHVANKYFPTDIRLNYEKYWYPHDGAKESEQDKLVAELMIRF